MTKEQISFPIGERIANPAFTGEVYLKPLISVDSVFKRWSSESHPSALGDGRVATEEDEVNPDKPGVEWFEMLSKEEYDKLPKE